MGMEALHAGAGAAHTARWTRPRPVDGHGGVAFRRVAPVGVGQRVLIYLGRCPPNPAVGFPSLMVGSSVHKAVAKAVRWKLLPLPQFTSRLLGVLGAVHFFNLYVLSRFRRRRMLETAPPPILPSRVLPA